MRLKSLVIEEDGTGYIAIGIPVSPLGEFSKEDLKTLDSSLRGSLRDAKETGELKSPR